MTHEPSTLDTATSGVRIFPPAIFLAGLVIGYLLHWLWPLNVVPADATVAIRILGAVVFLLGVALMAAAVGRFRHFGTSPNPTVPTTAFVRNGPYRFTRNPMYLGMTLMLAGLAFLGNALWPLIAVIPAVIITDRLVIQREENYLAARYGADYRAFKDAVRRWI